MAALALKDARSCRHDLVALGEVMLRFDPGERRIASARRFEVCEGGGEYNVARNLAHCFGLRTAIVTALVDNPVGRLLRGLMREGGVDLAHVRWIADDGAGRAARNGLNFVERGFGARAALGCSDRGHTAVAQLAPGQVDWELIFAGTDGGADVRWFHTGGIFSALSATTPAVAHEAMSAARRHGAVVSYDLNYRESLWRAAGGRAAADAVNAQLIPLADVLLGAGPDLERVARAHPHLKVIATTLREEREAGACGWSGACWANGTLHRAPVRDVAVLDRVGAGDAFAAGLIHALLAGRDTQAAVETGAALGALTMTTPGDAAQATPEELERYLRGSAAGGMQR